MISRHRPLAAPPRRGTRAPGWGRVSVLVALSLLLAPSLAPAQAPSPEEALLVVLEYLPDRSEVFEGWHLGVDPEWAQGIHDRAAIDADAHRELPARIAEAEELPFYPGEDFGRIICDASPDPEEAPENCRFSHGSRSLLRLIVMSSDEEQGVTTVHAFSHLIHSVAIRYQGEWRVGAPSRQFILEVEHGADGRAEVMVDRGVIMLRNGAAPIDEVRTPPPDR